MATSKTVASSFTIALGLIRVQGKLVPIETQTVKKKATETNLLCPTCVETGTPVKGMQRYTCDYGHGPFETGDMARGIPIGKDAWKIVSLEQLTALKNVKDELEANILALNVHPADEVERSTFSSGGAYLFYPSLQKDEVYAVLLELVDNLSVAFIGVANIKSAEHLFRLIRWNDRLVLQGITWPEDVTEMEEAPNASFSAEHLELAEKLAQNMTTAFNRDEYRSVARKRIAEFRENENAEVVTPAREKPVSDIFEALKQTLEAK